MSEELLKTMNELFLTKTKQELALNVMELTTENLDLQQRIDKAIELVNNIYFGNFFSELEPTKLADSKEGKELLSILKGEDKKW